MSTIFENYVTPVRELADLAIANVEELAAIQLNAAELYTSAGISAIKEAVSVKDVEGFKAYVDNQIAEGKKLAESTVAESRKIAELGQAYATEVKSIVERNSTIN